MKVLILPGLDGAGVLCEPFIEALGLDCEVLSYPNPLHDYDDVLDWVQDRLPEVPFVVVAESFSGPIAVRLAHAGHPRLCGVVFVATFARPPRYLPRLLLSFLSSLPINSRLIAFLVQPMVMGRWSTPHFRRLFGDVLQAVPRQTLICRLKQVSLIDVADLSSRLPVPATYLQAKSDRLVPARAANDFRRVQRIDGPHFLLQANPTETAALVADFVGECRPTQSR